MRKDFDMAMFMADICDAVGEGIWSQFVKNMEERGYTENEIEEGIAQIRKEDGRN